MKSFMGGLLALVLCAFAPSAFALGATWNITVVDTTAELQTTYSSCHNLTEQWAAGMPGVSYIFAVCTGTPDVQASTETMPSDGAVYGSVWLLGSPSWQSQTCVLTDRAFTFDMAEAKDVGVLRFVCETRTTGPVISGKRQ